MSDEKREWLVRKGGYFYRPNGAGYTTRKIEAGRYTKAEAVLEAAVEPLHMTVLHESEIPDEPAISAPPASGWSPAMTELDKDGLDAVLVDPIGMLSSTYRESNVRIVGYSYGKHRVRGECVMAVYVSADGRMDSAPIDWFVIKRPLPSPPKEG